MRMRLLFPALLLAVLAAFADDTRTNKPDLDRMQGQWSMISGSRGGYTMPAPPNSTRTCQSNEVTVIVGGNLVMKAKIALDASKKPKTIDYSVVEGPAAGQTLLGIYEINGDTAKFSYSVPGNERPSDFTTAGGDGRTSSVWRREKKQNE